MPTANTRQNTTDSTEPAVRLAGPRLNRRANTTTTATTTAAAIRANSRGVSM